MSAIEATISIIAGAATCVLAATWWVRGRRQDRVLDVELVSCAEFGGGWAFPRTEAGVGALMWFYGEPAYELYPFGGEKGYVVEPQDTRALCEHLIAENVAWGFA